MRSSRRRADGPASPAFALGWPVSELAPHLLTASAIDTAAELTVRRRTSKPSTLGLVAAAAAAGLLGWSIAGARRVGTELDEALPRGHRRGLPDHHRPPRTRPADPPRVGRPPVQVPPARRRADPQRPVHRGRAQGASGHLSAARRRPQQGPGAAPDPWRGLDHRHQGAAGPHPDEPDGAAGLGLRRVQLPARPQAPLPHADRRREAGDRLDPREHRAVRRRPVVPRHHRRIRRRSPLRPGRAHARPARSTSPASRTRTPRSRPASPSTASTTWPGSPRRGRPST